MTHAPDQRLLTTATVARRLGVTPATVRLLARSGKLPHETTESGTRLFRADDVEALAQARAERRALSTAVGLPADSTEPEAVSR